MLDRAADTVDYTTFHQGGVTTIQPIEGELNP
jgi:hypothetical protein